MTPVSHAVLKCLSCLPQEYLAMNFQREVVAARSIPPMRREATRMLETVAALQSRFKRRRTIKHGSSRH
jgi:hypothetical protein